MTRFLTGVPFAIPRRARPRVCTGFANASRERERPRNLQVAFSIADALINLRSRERPSLRDLDSDVRA